MGIRVSQNQGYHFGGPNNRDYNFFGGLCWVPPILGKYHIHWTKTIASYFIWGDHYKKLLRAAWYLDSDTLIQGNCPPKAPKSTN